MHGVRVELLEEQAKSLGIPLHKILVPEDLNMEVYDSLMEKTLSGFKKEGIDYSITGDIFLEDLRKYREEQLAKVHMKAVFPIWGRSTRELMKEFIQLGFKAVIVCINEKNLDQSFAGREVDNNFIKDLPLGVDPCGEYGEFHSFVYDGPVFRYPIKFIRGEIVYRQYRPVSRPPANDQQGNLNPSNQDPNFGFWYCDLIPPKN